MSNTITTTNTAHCSSINASYPYTYPYTYKSEIGVYEYIIYTLEEGDFELLDEGKIYANSEQNAKDKVLFDFAKSEEGEDYDLEDLNIQVRLF